MIKKEKSIVTPIFDSLRNINNGTIDVIKHKKLTQIYKGPIVRGCYHGRGFITWIEENEKQIYEGYFYVNMIHGYGRMIYENGLIFEGLFKDNMRFGPGVMTYPNQFQEVGFWIGTRIFRLSNNLTTHLVPSYSKNVSTKIKLLQFRHLIDLTEPPHSVINIRDDNEKYLNTIYSSPYTRHYNSLFFDAKTFDTEFISNSIIPENNIQMKKENRFICGYDLENMIQKNYLKIPKQTPWSNNQFLSKLSIGIDNQYETLNNNSWFIQYDHIESTYYLESDKKKSKTDHNHNIICNDCFFSKMLAYNNNTLDKMILAHAYQQRFGEKTLLYNIDDVWSGNRNMFMPSHRQELEAIKLLTKLDLKPESIKHIIQNYDIDLDVADSRGNTRLMISSANDQHEVIKCLINLGADLECYNDIGFTPLNLAIMRYICLLNNIENWTEYLIPHVNLQFNIIEGDQHIILNNIRKKNFFQPENLKNMKFTDNYDGTKEMISTTIQISTTKQTILLDSAENTILLLINLGAKATTCSIPKNSVHLALLTVNSNILKAVFDAGGSPTYTLSDENYILNLLHMAVMMPTNNSILQCIEVLITHYVNPNLNAPPIFSVFRYQLPWSKIANENNATMTPLDIFCLKENIYELNNELSVDEQSENELASILYDVTEKSHTYCGFKPIALAMLTGKLHLTKTFLNKNRSVVNEKISGFGTLLSLLLNPFYNFNLSYTKLNKMLDLLLKSNSNPLKIVKISDEKFRGNICEYFFSLSESEKMNGEIHSLGYLNVTKIVNKLRNSGRGILDNIYTKRATVALKNDRKHNTTPLLSVDEKIAMLHWLDLGNKILTHQAKIVKLSNNQSFTSKTVKNNTFNIKENTKNETYALCLQQIKSTTHNPINLTKEESQVCYECLQHQPKDMKACLNCYFALLCSEKCAIQHNKEDSCKVQIRKDYTIKIQNKLNNNQTDKKLNLSSTHLIPAETSIMNSEKLNTHEYISLSSSLSQSLKTIPTTMHSRSSAVSKTLDNLSSDTYNYSKESQNTHTKKYNKYNKNKLKDGSKHPRNNKMNDSVSTQNIDSSVRRLSSGVNNNEKNYVHPDIRNDTRKQSKQSRNKRNSYEDGSNYSRNNKMYYTESLQSTDSIVRRRSNGLDDDKMNSNHLASAVKLGNNNEFNDKKLRQKSARDRYKKRMIYNKVDDLLIPSVKYRTVRSPGCWIPIFMFINRGSYKDVTILKNVIISGMSYFMIEKNGQVIYSNINYNQYGMLNNYSLI